MIIKRIAQGIKNQDWFVVTIEVMIVVVGIFIGLQVTDWNEARKEKQSEKQYIETLYEDFSFNVEEAKNLMDLHATYRDRVNAIMTYLVEEKIDGAKHKEITAKRLGAVVFPSSQYHMGTYEELISVGKINILQDKALRQALQTFAARKSRIDGQLDYFRMNLDYIGNHLDKMYSYHINEKGVVESTLQLNNFVGDREMIDPLYDSYAKHLLFNRYREAEYIAAKEVRNILACILAIPQCNEKAVQ